MHDEAAESPRASDSPRTQVMSKFGKLEIHDPFRFRQPRIQEQDQDQAMETDTDTPTPKKRRKIASPAPPYQASPDPEGAYKGRIDSLPTSPPMSPARLHIPPAPMPTPALPSTPTATPSTSPLKPTLSAKSKPVSPLRLSAALHSPHSKSRRPRSPSPRLTWTPAEITGYTIDTSSPGDRDGLGINGLGFEPSAAEAEQRRARREKQISEWRAREARDDRRKRAERRRGVGEGGGTKARDGERRGVRFAVG